MFVFSAGASLAPADVFTWSPQCPSPTWFGVCEGEICDVGNNTPLSLNNWGRSGCGDVAFPGVGDDVIIPTGTVDQVATQINSMLIEPAGTFRFVGENLSCPTLTNNGRIEVASVMPMSTLSGGAHVDNGGVIEFVPPGGSLKFFAATINNSGVIELDGQLIDGNDSSDIFNSGTIRSQGISEIDSLNNTGILEVQSGRLSLRRRIENAGQIIQSSTDAEIEFGTPIEGALIAGDFSVDVIGQAFSGGAPSESGGTTSLGIRPQGATFNFSGNGFEIRRAQLFCQPEAVFRNGSQGIITNYSGETSNCPIINDGLFIDVLYFGLQGTSSTFENYGNYEVSGFGSLQSGEFTNYGQVRKTGAESVTMTGAFDNSGMVAVEEGSLTINAEFGAGLILNGDWSVAVDANLKIVSSVMSGTLNVLNQGVFSLAGVNPNAPLFNFNPTDSGLLVNVEGNPINFDVARSSNDATGTVTISEQTKAVIGGTGLSNDRLFRFSWINNGITELLSTRLIVDELINHNTLLFTGNSASIPVSVQGYVRNEALLMSTGVTTASINANFENAGDVLVESGGLHLEGQLTVEPGSSLYVAEGAEFELGTVELSGDLIVAGQGEKTSGPEGEFVSWSVGPTGASLFFDGDGMTAELLSISVPLGAQLEHRENSFLRMNRKFDTTVEGLIVNNGVIEIEDVFGSIGLFDGTVLVNNGTIRHLGACRFLNEGGGPTRIQNSGTFVADNAPSSLWQPLVENTGRLFLGSNDQRFTSGLASFSGRVSSGGSLYLQATGMPNGLLVLGGGILQLETLPGQQRFIFGDVDFSGGTLVNSTEVGDLRIEGNLRLRGTGGRGFAVDIAGPPGNFNYDKITVTGTVTTLEAVRLNYGTLRVTALDGYVPDIGDTYSILTCFSGVPAGYFDQIVTVGFPPNLTVEPAFEANRIRLDIAYGETPTMLGDMNCDRRIDADDITGFVTALTDRDAYAFEIPICDANRADMNADGVLNGADIPLFMQVLLD